MSPPWKKTNANHLSLYIVRPWLAGLWVWPLTGVNGSPSSPSSWVINSFSIYPLFPENISFLVNSSAPRKYGHLTVHCKMTPCCLSTELFLPSTGMLCKKLYEIYRVIEGNFLIEIYHVIHGNFLIEIYRVIHGNFLIEIYRVIHGNFLIEIYRVIHGNFLIEIKASCMDVKQRNLLIWRTEIQCMILNLCMFVLGIEALK